MAWVIIIIALIIGAVIGIYKVNQTKQLAKEGKIIQRPLNFWENKELFTTTATYTQVKTCIKNNRFDGNIIKLRNRTFTKVGALFF